MRSTCLTFFLYNAQIQKAAEIVRRTRNKTIEEEIPIAKMLDFNPEYPRKQNVNLNMYSSLNYTDTYNLACTFTVKQIHVANINHDNNQLWTVAHMVAE